MTATLGFTSLIKSMKLLQHIFNNPELLEHNANELVELEKE